MGLSFCPWIVISVMPLASSWITHRCLPLPFVWGANALHAVFGVLFTPRLLLWPEVLRYRCNQIHSKDGDLAGSGDWLEDDSRLLSFLQLPTAAAFCCASLQLPQKPHATLLLLLLLFTDYYPLLLLLSSPLFLGHVVPLSPVTSPC